MNLPNKITLTRICMIPVFVVLFYVNFPYHELVAAAIFAIAAFTDFLDGHIARSRGLVTNLGKFLDPIADKVLVSTALILLLTRPAVFEQGGFANWGTICAGIFVAVILARELIVSGFRMIAAGRNLVLAADMAGKVKTVVQDICIVALLAAEPFLGTITGSVFAGIGFGLLTTAAALTVFSGIRYIVINRHVLKEEKQESDKPEHHDEEGEQA